MELFGQGLHKFVLAGQLAGVNLRTVQGRKILLPIEAARKIVSMLQRPEFDVPVFAGIQALHAAAVVAHLGQNAVMRLRNIGGRSRPPECLRGDTVPADSNGQSLLRKRPLPTHTGVFWDRA